MVVNGLFSLCEHIVICEYWNSVLFVLFDRILILVESMECWSGFMVGNVQDCVVVESGLFDFCIQFMG